MNTHTQHPSPPGGSVPPSSRRRLSHTELCQSSANSVLSASPKHGRVCLICAEACEACAKSCEQVGDMRECVDECQSCAKS